MSIPRCSYYCMCAWWPSWPPPPSMCLSRAPAIGEVGREGGREAGVAGEVGENAVFLGPFGVKPVRVGEDFSEGVALEPEGGREGGKEGRRALYSYFPLYIHL